MNQPTAAPASLDAKSDSIGSDALRCPVVSIEKSCGPDGSQGGDWYRYVIDSPGSPIIGYRRGKKSDVVAYLNECTRNLEERLNPRKSSRANSRQNSRAKTSK